MTHAVHFRDAAGSTHLEEVPSLDTALERVERLRNDEGATDVRVFREVPIEVRTYYRVVAVEDVVPNVPAQPAVPEAAAETPVPPPVPTPPVEPPSGAMVMTRPPAAVSGETPTDGVGLSDEAAGSEHRRQLFSRS